MSGSTTARMAARYSASARGVSQADLQQVYMLLCKVSPFLASITTQPKISFKTTSPTLIAKTKISPSNVSIGANAWSGTSFLRSSGAREKVASVMAVDRDVHHLGVRVRRLVVEATDYNDGEEAG